MLSSPPVLGDKGPSHSPSLLDCDSCSGTWFILSRALPVYPSDLTQPRSDKAAGTSVKECSGALGSQSSSWLQEGLPVALLWQLQGKRERKGFDWVGG